MRSKTLAQGVSAKPSLASDTIALSNKTKLVPVPDVIQHLAKMTTRWVCPSLVQYVTALRSLVQYARHFYNMRCV